MLGAAEARARFLGDRLGDSLPLAGTVVVVEARLTSPEFEADGETFQLHDGMIGLAEVQHAVALAAREPDPGVALAMAAPEQPAPTGEPPPPDDAAPPPSAAELFPSLEKLARARRGRKVPFVQQLEAADCGAACLAMVLGYLGRDVTLDEVREAAGGSGRDGIDALAIVRAAEWFGLRGRGLALDVEHLRFLPPRLDPALGVQPLRRVRAASRKKGVEIVDPGDGPARGLARAGSASRSPASRSCSRPATSSSPSGAAAAGSAGT